MEINKIVESLAANFDDITYNGGADSLIRLVKDMAKVCHDTTNLGLMVYRESMKAMRHICKGFMIIAFTGNDLGLDLMKTVNPRKRVYAPILDIYINGSTGLKIEFNVMDVELDLKFSGQTVTVREYISDEMDNEIIYINSLSGFKATEK